MTTTGLRHHHRGMTTNDSAYFDNHHADDDDDDDEENYAPVWNEASRRGRRQQQQKQQLLKQHLNEAVRLTRTTTTATTITTTTANFPAARMILWDDDDAKEETLVGNTSSSSHDGSGHDDGHGNPDGLKRLCRCEAYANAPVISMSGRTTETMAKIISEMQDEDEGVDGVRARGRWAVRPRVVCLVGDNSDASSTVTVTAASRGGDGFGEETVEEDDDDDDDVLGDRQVEISAVLVPYDAVGNEYSVSSTLHGTAWDDEEALRRAFHLGCESDAPLCPAAFYPMRAAATLVDDESSPGDLALRIVFAVDAPACTFELRRINPLRMASNGMSQEMLDDDDDDDDDNASADATGSQRSDITTGFVTLDRARRVILLDESAIGTREEPVTGVWVRGVDGVDGAAVWAACLRFACSERLNKLTQRGKFLLVSYVAGASVPQFFEVTASHASSPFVPYGIDAVVRPGEPILVKSTPLDEGVVPSYFTVKPEEYEARYYRDASSTDEDAEDYETDDEAGYVDEALYDEAYELERRERAAQMEMLQKEIDSLRDAIARASEEDARMDEDDEEYDEPSEDEYQVRRIKESDDEEDKVSVSDQVHLLAEDLSKKIMQSRGVAEDEGTFRAGFDPAAAGYVRVPENEDEANALADALRDVDEDILRLRRPNELALDRESQLRAQLRAEYGDVPQMVAAEAGAKHASDEYFPKIKFNPDALIDEEEGEGEEDDDDIIRRYVDQYGEDDLLAAL